MIRQIFIGIAVCTSLTVFSQKTQGKITELLFGKPSNRSEQLQQLLENIPDWESGEAVLYWTAYTHYTIALDQLTNGKHEAKKHLESSIEALEGIKNKNSEEFTLLAAINSAMINIVPENAWPLSIKVEDLYKKALKLDSKNPRIYLGMGKSDFYKPTQYGGGEKAEGYFKKALELFTEEADAPYGINWGKDEAYLFLAIFYSRKGRGRDARFYNGRGLKEFPNHPNLLKQKIQLEEL